LPDNLPRRRIAEWRDMQQHPRFYALFYRFLQADNFIFAFVFFQTEGAFSEFF
jgi:hypothetical protein